MAEQQPNRTGGGVGLLMPDPVDGDGRRGTSRAAYLLDALRVRPLGRRVLSLLSAVLFLLGAAMFAWPFFTDVYAEQMIQRPLEQEFSQPEFRETYVTRTVQAGDPLTRIIIPSIDVDAIVVHGTSAQALRAGAGHYPNTPLPGEPGNMAIAGHRTTYGKPFNELDEVGVGAEIILETPLATHRYRVVRHPSHVPEPCPNGACWITNPQDWGVVGPLDGHMLTLTTCHPKGSARERLIVRAELEETIPRDAATG
jgi:sortase A